MIEAHNSARRLVGQRKLVWDARLVASARSYAERLASTQILQHSEIRHGDAGYGENLWMGTRRAFTFAEMAGAWIEEGGNPLQRQRDGADGQESTGFNHYTQVIAHETTAVGCALSSSATDDYLVCHYYPPGNVIRGSFGDIEER